MKVVHVCNNLWWGAGKAARRLHEGLLRIGVDSHVVVRDAKDATAPQVEQIDGSADLATRVLRSVQSARTRRALDAYATTRPQGGDLFVDDRCLPRLSEHPRVREADVVHLHWVGTSGHSEHFFRDLEGKRVVWTLHDMLPFTGGCVYAGDCTRHRERCGACPQLGSIEQHDLSRNIWERKQRAYARHAGTGPALRVIAPSRWLGQCAKESLLLGNCRVDVIPYGLDLELFQPRDRAHCRQLLGIPPDEFVVLAGSLDARTTRKGFRHLLQALELVVREPGPQPLSLLTFGGHWSGTKLPDGVRLRALGQVNDERLMSCAYSAADITALPSLEDNLPLVMLESLASGTAVVGFETGGVPDAVRDGVTGHVVPRGDSTALGAAIRSLWLNPERARALGQAARAEALTRFDLEGRARDVLRVYESMAHG